MAVHRKYTDACCAPGRAPRRRRRRALWRRLPPALYAACPKSPPQSRPAASASLRVVAMVVRRAYRVRGGRVGRAATQRALVCGSDREVRGRAFERLDDQLAGATCRAGLVPRWRPGAVHRGQRGVAPEAPFQSPRELPHSNAALLTPRRGTGGVRVQTASGRGRSRSRVTRTRTAKSTLLL